MVFIFDDAIHANQLLVLRKTVLNLRIIRISWVVEIDFDSVTVYHTQSNNVVIAKACLNRTNLPCWVKVDSLRM